MGRSRVTLSAEQRPGSWLLAGGSGFLGRALIASLRAADPSVQVEILSRWRDRGVTLADLSARSSGSSPDTLVYLSAISEIAECERDPQAARRIQVQELRELLALPAMSELKRVILISSAAVYRNAAPSTPLPFNEDSPTPASSLYAQLKLDAENLVRDWAQERPGFRQAAALRLGNLYGPGMHPRTFLGRVSVALKDRRPGQETEVPIQGTAFVRGFLHVNDAAEGVRLCSKWLGQDPLAGEGGFRIRNLSARQELTGDEWVKLISRVLPGVSIRNESVSRGSSLDVLRISSERFRAETGWEERVQLEKGLVQVLVSRDGQ